MSSRQNALFYCSVTWTSKVNNVHGTELDPGCQLGCLTDASQRQRKQPPAPCKGNNYLCNASQ